MNTRPAFQRLFIAALLITAGCLVAASAAANSLNSTDAVLIPGDFNGDGRTDLFVQATSPQGTDKILLTDFTNTPSVVQQSWTNGYLGINWDATSVRIYVADFNGDGHADLLVQSLTSDQAWLLIQDTSNASQPFHAITATFSTSTLGYSWNAIDHNLVIGDFNGDGRADVLMQAAYPSGTDVILLSTSSGFTVEETWQDGYLGLNWSQAGSVISAGDFNGDGRDDLFVQGLPTLILIAVNPVFPVSVDQPNSFATLDATAAGQFTTITQIWSRYDFGVDWSPITHQAIIGDFNGDGRDDILLQDTGTTNPTWLITASSTGMFGTVTQTWNNGDAGINWSRDYNRLIAGDFNGDGVTDLYIQSQTSSTSNAIARFSNGTPTLTQLAPENLGSAQSPGDGSSSGGGGSGSGNSNVVGTIPGQFSVDPSGAATYKVSIQVPPGVHGIQPDLALLYNSHAGDGDLGVGWSISGLSVITRCGQNLEDDGQWLPPSLKVTDRFCMDGQRLVPSPPATPSNYWSGNGSYEYRTKFASVQRIVANGVQGNGPYTFTAYDKTAMTRSYGPSASVVGSDGKTMLMWPINEIADPLGNYITYSYVSAGGSSANEYLLKEIDYGNAYGVQVGSVVFNYQVGSRPDDQYAISATTGISTTSLLQSVQVYGPGGQLVRQYNLGYVTSVRTGRTLLQTLQECDPSKNCVAPTTFTYPRSTSGIAIGAGTSDTPGVDTTQPGSWKTLDLDGDGLADYVYVNSDNTVHVILGKDLFTDIPTGIPANGNALRLNWGTVADFYGTGKQELLAPYVTGQGSCSSTPDYYELLAWQNGALVVDPHYKLIGPTATNYPNGQQPNEYTANIPVAIDTEGRGLPSLFTKQAPCGDNPPAETLWVWHNNGNGWDAPVQTGISFGDTDNAIQPINYDGKGFDEFYIKHCGTNQTVCQPGGIYTWNTSNNTLQSIGNDFYSFSATNPVFLDYNGDGLTDAVIPLNGQWCFFLNDGKGWSPNPNTPGVQPKCVILDTRQASQAVVLDYFGNGHQDLVVPVQNTGGAQYWWVAPVDPLSGIPGTLVDTGIYFDGNINDFFGDANGDGLPDYISTTASGTELKIAYNNNTGPELLGEIQTANAAGQSLGSTTVINYLPLPLANAAGWTTGAGPAADLGGSSPRYRPYMGPIPLVVESYVDSGLGSGNNTQWLYTYYRYGGAEMDAWGRGFLGFSDLQTVNENAGILTESFFSQGLLTAGMVLSASQYQIPANELSVITNPLTTVAGVRCTWVVEHEGGASIRTRECDYGNAGYSGFTPYTGLQLLNQTVNAEPVVLNLSQGGSFAYSPTSTASSYELGSGSWYKQVITTPTYVIDPSGNNPQTTDVTVETKTAGGDDYKVDTNSIQYLNYTGNPWCVLGRVTSSTVQDAWIAAAAGSIQTANGASSPAHTATFQYQNCMVSEEDSSIVSPNGTSSSIAKTYGFDGYGNINSTTVNGKNPDNSPIATRVSSVQYDYYGLYPILSTNTLKQTSTSSWDYRFGLSTSTTDPNGLRTSTSYDNFGRKATAQGVLAAQQTSWSYDWCGVSANCLSPNAVYAYTQFVNSEVQPGTLIPSAVTEYDRLGRPVFTTHLGLYGTPSYQVTYYDALSRQYLTSQPYQSGDPVCWDYKVYDVLNRITTDYQPLNTAECQSQGIAVIAPGGPAPGYSRNTVYTYAGLTTTVKHVQETSISTLNALGKAATFTDAKGKSTQYAYDAWGNTAEVLDATGQNKILITSDSAGDKLSMTDPDMGQWTYTYDALGELVTQLDPNEATKQPPQPPTTLKYDLLGRLIERDEPEGVSTWRYDAAYGAGIGKLAYETGPNGYWEGYAYDGFGEVTDKITVANGQEYWVSTTYDNFGQVAQVVYPNLTALNVSGSTAPNGPASLTLAMDANNAQVDASWPNAANGAIYHLFRAAGASAPFSSASEIYVGPDPSFKDTAAPDGPVTYFVEACDGSSTNCSAPASNSLTVNLAPTVPSMVIVPSNDSHQPQLTVAWSASILVGGAPAPITYRVLQSFNGGGYSSVATSSGVFPTAQVALSSDGNYQFEVQACGHSNTVCSLPSAPSAVYGTYIQPTAPQNVASTATLTPNPGYNVSWSAPATTGGSVVYNLQESYNGATTPIASQTSATSQFLTHAQTGQYGYQVQACNAHALSVCSGFASLNGVTVPVPATTSSSLAPGANGGGTITLNWSDATAGVNSYGVYKASMHSHAWGSYGLTYQGSAQTMTSNWSSISEGVEFDVIACTPTACTPTPSSPPEQYTQNLCGSSCTSSTLQPQAPFVAPTMTRPQSSAPRADGALLAVTSRIRSRPLAATAPASLVGRTKEIRSVSPLDSPRGRLASSLRLDAPAVQFAPMPKARKVRWRVVRAYQAVDRIAAVNPVISAYPPLRHDSRVWAHYAAAGGTAPGWAERAGCNGSSCSETAGTYALMVGYSYDAYGHQVSVTRLDESGNPQYNYWLAVNANAHGQVTQEGLQLPTNNVSMGIGVTRSYDLATGLVNCIDATVQSPQATCGNVSGALQSDSYAWDPYGNLASRSSSVTGLSETFGYDADNRLDSVVTKYNGTQVASDAPNYMDNNGGTPGDIYQRAGATYSYPQPGSALPHAVSSITLPGGGKRNFVYDYDGNLTTETGDVSRTLTWYSYNKPLSINSSGGQDTFFYGPDRDRYERVSQVNGDTITTIYISGLFEAQNDQSTGTTTYRNYVMAGSQMVAVDSFQGTSGSAVTETVSYYLHDHLGEVAATVSGTGTGLTQYSYDAWGKVRPTTGAGAFVSAAWGSCGPTLPGQRTGFGTHENLDDQCLVHMEGRVYDPDMGRFVSADPTMQDPISTQGYDRYGYIQNNPLSGTDPDGHHFHDIAGPVEGILSAFSEECSYCAAAAVAIAAVDGYQQTGSYKGAALDAGEAYVMYEIGEHFPGNYGVTDAQFWEKAALEGLAGGAFSQAGGGRFGDGFLGGFAGSVAGNFIDPGNGEFFDTAKAVTEAYIAGGTASAIGGGNFANGGSTAAFVELFNHLSHVIINQFQRGMDAHDTYQQYAKSLDPSLFTDQFSDGNGTYFGGGRPDIGDPATQQLWEIKPDNLGQILLGKIQLDYYSLGSGGKYIAGDMPDTFGGRETITLRGIYASYTYRYAGGGIVAYSYALNSNVSEVSVPVRIPVKLLVPPPTNYSPVLVPP